METLESKRFVYEFGEFVLDPDEKTLFVGGTPVHLPAKEFETLLLLVEHNGHALTKEEMMSAVWQDAFVEESNLAKQISRLRKVINTNGEEYIETLPKHGYRFKADLRRTKVEPGEPLILEKRTVRRVRLAVENESAPQLALPGARVHLFTKRRVTVGALLAIAGLAGLGYWVNRTPATPRLESIAVIPIKAYSEDEKDRLLAAGLTDALMTKLGALKPVVVRPASAVEQFVNVGTDSADIGRKLNVGSVLEGSVREADGKLRVNMRLVDAQTGQQIWSDRFDGAFTDMFELEDRISEKVARTLMPTVTGDPAGRLTRRYTDNADAYDAYIRGRYLLAKRTEDGFRRAIEYFNDAVAKDPNYALAYSGLADCYILLGVWGTNSPNEVFPQARQAAEKALQSDPELPEALVSLAFVEWVHGWEFEKAGTNFRRAIELNPNYATAHHWYSYYLVSQGRNDEAIAEIKKAQELEGPLTLSVNTDIGEIYSWAGRYDEAEPYLRNVLKLEPNYAVAHHVLGINLLKQNRVEEAIVEEEAARHLETEPRVLAVLGYAYAIAGNTDKAREIINELDVLSKQKYVSPFSRGIVYIGLGENDEALNCFENAYNERSDTMAILQAYPLLDKLKADPDFVELGRKVGYFR
jgi:DNA-binding winged helix-turn-helix (wHTH) protein/TolB-like protein/Tfp pilus assembly protein PilF